MRALWPCSLRWSRSRSACVCFPLWSSPSKAMSNPDITDIRGSRLERQLIVDRLPSPDHPPRAVLHEHLARKRTTIVIRRHDGSVGTGVSNGDEIADLEARQPPIASDDIGA